ncbi:hypothetical protein [Naasia sp. SYSU D00948]|uniref:hypothetical protein n=1 Tax=Naasia sp. SYSU D00948 TaxID=2817379 RepID=UPI001B30E812|nr:hypothetical protein [Naasia sp. SYSU D00948]
MREKPRAFVLSVLVALLGAVVAISVRKQHQSPTAISQHGASTGSFERPLAPDILDRSNLRARSVEVFPTAYSALLSVVQGLALGALVAKIFEGDDGAGAIPVWMQAFTSLVTITVVFYMYSWLVLVARWTPTIFDTLVPLVLGMSEIALVSQVGSTAWILFLALVQLAGSAAFLHSILRIRPDLFEHVSVFVSIRKLLLFLMLLASSSGGVAVFGWAWLNGAPAEQWISPFASAGGLVVGIIMVVASEVTLRRIFAQYGLTFFR